MSNNWTAIIDKNDISDAKLVTVADKAPLAEGQIEVTIKSYALTSNNVTYATLGKSFGSWTDMPGYWAFFPYADPDYGCLPVWGFATITESKHSELEVGEEIYGYFPMASHLRMMPDRISAASFHDVTEHRQKLAPVYNQYTRMKALEALSDEDKNLWPVFRPLLVTGYMICDQFADDHFYGAQQLIIGSASSKTALMTAKSFGLFEDVPKLIGLTSQGNKAFVEESGLYDQVLTYDEIAQLDASIPTALIDMAGNGAVIDQLHHHLEDNMKYSCLVGLSHWNSGRPSRDLPGAPVTPFFAPGRIKMRSGDWGAEGLQKRLDAAWDNFAELAPSLTAIEIISTPEKTILEYQNLVAGKIDPSKSIMIHQ